MRTFKAALIGAGAIAKNHASVLNECDRTEFVAVADIDIDRARSLAAKYGTAVYTDYRSMLREERPDIVIISLPHYLHKEAAIACIEQGCHILLEKPMALNVRECAEINEAARKYGVHAAVGHMQHYFAANAKAKEMIASGRLGRLVTILDRRHYPYFLPERPSWFLDKARSGGGIVINLGSHSIDKIQWIGGSFVTKAKAVLSYYGTRGNVEGNGNLFLQTADGVAATVSLCGYNNVPINETEFLCTAGQLKITGPNSLWIAGDDRIYEPFPLGEPVNPFTAQWNDLLGYIEHGGPFGNSGTYGQTVCAVVEAVYRSDETGTEQDVVVGADVTFAGL